MTHVCMHVLCVNVSVCMFHVRIHSFIYMCTCMHVAFNQIHTHTHTHEYSRVCIFCTRVHISTFVHLYMHPYTHVRLTLLHLPFVDLCQVLSSFLQKENSTPVPSKLHLKKRAPVKAASHYGSQSTSFLNQDSEYAHVISTAENLQIQKKSTVENRVSACSSHITDNTTQTQNQTDPDRLRLRLRQTQTQSHTQNQTQIQKGYTYRKVA
jgi:hypothetical protein